VLSLFRAIVSGREVPNDCLPALGDVDMLHRHLLLAAASVSLQCLNLSGERPGELVARRGRKRPASTGVLKTLVNLILIRRGF
jgi:hypothetical protein